MTKIELLIGYNDDGVLAIRLNESNDGECDDIESAISETMYEVISEKVQVCVDYMSQQGANYIKAEVDKRTGS